MKIITLILPVLLIAACERNVYRTVNKADGSVEVVYGPSSAKHAVPVMMFKNIKKGDTTFAMLFSKSIKHSEFLKSESGSFDRLEIMQANGRITVLPEKFKDSSYVNFTLEAMDTYKAYIHLRINPEIFGYFKKAIGVKLNEGNDWLMFGDSPNQDEYPKIVAAFVDDNPAFY